MTWVEHEMLDGLILKLLNIPKPWCLLSNCDSQGNNNYRSWLMLYISTTCTLLHTQLISQAINPNNPFLRLEKVRVYRFLIVQHSHRFILIVLFLFFRNYDIIPFTHATSLRKKIQLKVCRHPLCTRDLLRSFVQSV